MGCSTSTFALLCCRSLEASYSYLLWRNILHIISLTSHRNRTIQMRQLTFLRKCQYFWQWIQIESSTILNVKFRNNIWGCEFQWNRRRKTGLSERSGTWYRHSCLEATGNSQQIRWRKSITCGPCNFNVAMQQRKNQTGKRLGMMLTSFYK